MIAAVVAAVGLLTGCGAVATAGQPPSSSHGYDVATRVLDLRDPSRVTDPTPEQPGADAVRGRDLPTLLFYPSSGPGPFPVVEFSHGLGSDPQSYWDLLSSWAAAGFVVAAPTFPLTNRHSAQVKADVLNQPADVSFVLTKVLALDTTRGDALAGRIDTAHVAVAGHSAGAITTIGLLDQCCRDPRITAAVVLSGGPEGFGAHFAAPGVPMLWVHGTADQVLPIDQDRTVYAAAPGPKAFVELIGGTHSAPYDTPSDPHAGAVRAVTTDFLRAELDGDAGALARLRADATRPGITRLADDRLGD